MTIQSKREGNIDVVSVGGRLDAVTAPEYEKTVRELVGSGTIRLVVDFQELSYISSAGLGEIIVTLKLMKEKQGQFCMANVHGNVLSVFKMCGIGKLVKIHDSVADAVAALA